VKVLDTFWFGDFLPGHERLTKIIGDLRDPCAVDTALTASTPSSSWPASRTTRRRTSTPS
jgi:hypothetical protein